jgi:hypothetical protein
VEDKPKRARRGKISELSASLEALMDWWVPLVNLAPEQWPFLFGLAAYVLIRVAYWLWKWRKEGYPVR